ncbi:MAG TPA: hypothetical protein VFK03_00365, partial [Candidatus Saccharimonadales bacterium]|nr:hypothetical protein [Candidatus Saccharimonadales bacterium]
MPPNQQQPTGNNQTPADPTGSIGVPTSPAMPAVPQAQPQIQTGGQPVTSAPAIQPNPNTT